MPDLPCYAAVIDASSSGTRLLIYQWKLDAPDEDYNECNAAKSGLLPEPGPNNWFELKLIKKGDNNDKGDFETERRSGGLAQQSLDEIEHYLKKPLDDAIERLSRLPQEQRVRQRTIPTYILATAGMRKLQNSVGKWKVDAIMSKTSDVIMRTTLLRDGSPSPIFDVRSSRVITGEQEGLFAWVAMNYGRSNSSFPITDIIELGGASMQIAYEHDEHHELRTLGKYSVCLHMSEKHWVFSNSWDGLGVEETRADHIGRLVKSKNGYTLDPCLPIGQVIERDAKRGFPTLKGTGDFDKCRDSARIILGKADGNKKIPLYSGLKFDDKRLMGISNLFFSYEFTAFTALGGYRSGDGYKALAFAKGVSEYCGGRGPFDDSDFKATRCFNAAFMLELLHNQPHGLGMSPYKDWTSVFKFPHSNPEKLRSSWTVGVAALAMHYGEPLRSCPGGEELFPSIITSGNVPHTFVPLRFPHESIQMPIDSTVIESSVPVSLPTLSLTDRLTSSNLSIFDIANIGCYIILAVMLFVMAYRRIQKSRSVKGKMYLSEKVNEVLQV